MEIAARAKIVFADGVWLVPSQTTGAKYRVTVGPEPSCDCDDFQLRKQPCKHVVAARLVCARDHDGKAPEIITDAVPKKPTYKQNWPAYNEAQTYEKERFQTLLFELCRGVQEPEPKFGRPRTPYRDVVFAACFKVYSTVSSRRFMTDLREAHAKGYLSKTLHYNSINGYLENPNLTPILSNLIVRSSLPLRAVESTFVPDSSGFSTSRFVRWFDEKYGVQCSGHDWVKAHIMTGTRTNIITAAVIADRNAADSPQFPELLQTTAKNFAVKEVPADKAYLSKDNLELVTALGATPYIPFKSNSVAGEAGSLWEKMFFYYSLHREEFLTHYHQRSNVESTLNMVKAKFRDHVRSRTDTAMKNEVLCKFICHNVCVVIQSQCELGIEAAFWGDKPAPQEAVILPMVRDG